MKITDKYTIKTTPIKQIDHIGWEYTLVEIIKNEDIEFGVKVGEFTRNYPISDKAFYPFEQNGKEYALYSSNYTCTRVMELPSCKDICGEDPAYNGFCPTDYYVPNNEDDPYKGTYGFIEGTMWGDDWCVKIQFLDLSKISEGIFIRKEAFGYWPLPNNVSLKDCVDCDYDYWEGTQTETIQLNIAKNGYIELCPKTMEVRDIFIQEDTKEQHANAVLSEISSYLTTNGYENSIRYKDILKTIKELIDKDKHK